MTKAATLPSKALVVRCLTASAEVSADQSSLERGVCVKIRSLCLDLLREFGVAFCLIILGGFCSWIGIAGAPYTTSSVAGVLVLSFFDFDARVLDNEGGQPMTHVDVGSLATGLAITDDLFGSAELLNDKFGFRVPARFAQNKFIDEDIEKLVEAIGVVGAIDNVSVVFLIKIGLSAKFVAEKLGDVGGWTIEGSSDVGHVEDNGLDPISLSFDFGSQGGHAVAVELVIDIAANVNESQV